MLLVYAILLGYAGLMLIRKWNINSYMNVHPLLHHVWPSECELCQMFWIGVIAHMILLFVPYAEYILIPFAAIPVQILFAKLK